MEFLKIDGSYGEGGGQIVRSAVTLSCITKTPIQIENIRTNRKVPGLRPQHLTAIKLLGKICNAEIQGLNVGSKTIKFFPNDFENDEQLLRRGMREIFLGQDRAWKEQALTQFGESQEMALVVPVENAKIWADIKTRLASSPVISGINVARLAFPETYIAITFSGTEEQLALVGETDTGNHDAIIIRPCSNRAPMRTTCRCRTSCATSVTASGRSTSPSSRGTAGGRSAATVSR